MSKKNAGITAYSVVRSDAGGATALLAGCVDNCLSIRAERRSRQAVAQPLSLACDVVVGSNTDTPAAYNSTTDQTATPPDERCGLLTDGWGIRTIGSRDEAELLRISCFGF